MSGIGREEEWSDLQLGELQEDLVRGLAPYTAASLTLSGPPWLVRGIVADPRSRGLARLVFWDGTTLNSSLACNVPLTDPWRGNVPHTAVAPALREFLTALPVGTPPGSTARDHMGIPVLNAVPWIRSSLKNQLHTPTDALYNAVLAFSPTSEERQDTEVRLRGFLFLTTARVRLYTVSGPLPGITGVDISLRDRDGAPASGFTALATALPALIRDGELDLRPVGYDDAYCTKYYDLTDW